MTTPTLKFMTVDGEVELPLEYTQRPRLLSDFCERQVKRTLASSLPDEQVALLLACLACGIGFTTRERALEVLHIAQDIHPTRAAADQIRLLEGPPRSIVALYREERAVWRRLERHKKTPKKRTSKRAG